MIMFSHNVGCCLHKNKSVIGNICTYDMDMGWGRMEAVIAAESCLTSIPPCGWAGPVWTRVFSRLISLTHRGTTLHYTCCHTHTSPTQSTRNNGSMQKQGCSFVQCSSERVVSNSICQIKHFQSFTAKPAELEILVEILLILYIKCIHYYNYYVLLYVHIDMELFMYWGQEYILQKYTNTSINWLDIFFLLFSFKFPGLSVIILFGSGAGRFDRKMCLHFTKVFDNYLNILSRDIKCQLNFETSI